MATNNNRYLSIFDMVINGYRIDKDNNYVPQSTLFRRDTSLFTSNEAALLALEDRKRKYEDRMATGTTNLSLIAMEEAMHAKSVRGDSSPPTIDEINAAGEDYITNVNALEQLKTKLIPASDLFYKRINEFNEITLKSLAEKTDQEVEQYFEDMDDHSKYKFDLYSEIKDSKSFLNQIRVFGKPLEEADWNENWWKTAGVYAGDVSKSILAGLLTVPENIISGLASLGEIIGIPNLYEKSGMKDFLKDGLKNLGRPTYDYGGGQLGLDFANAAGSITAYIALAYATAGASIAVTGGTKVGAVAGTALASIGEAGGTYDEYLEGEANRDHFASKKSYLESKREFTEKGFEDYFKNNTDYSKAGGAARFGTSFAFNFALMGGATGVGVGKPVLTSSKLTPATKAAISQVKADSSLTRKQKNQAIQGLTTRMFNAEAKDKILQSTTTKFMNSFISHGNKEGLEEVIQDTINKVLVNDKVIAEMFDVFNDPNFIAEMTKTYGISFVAGGFSGGISDARQNRAYQKTFDSLDEHAKNSINLQAQIYRQENPQLSEKTARALAMYDRSEQFQLADKLTKELAVEHTQGAIEITSEIAHSIKQLMSRDAEAAAIGVKTQSYIEAMQDHGVPLSKNNGSINLNDYVQNEIPIQDFKTIAKVYDSKHGADAKRLLSDRYLSLDDSSRQKISLIVDNFQNNEGVFNKVLGLIRNKDKMSERIDNEYKLYTELKGNEINDVVKVMYDQGITRKELIEQNSNAMINSLDYNNFQAGYKYFVEQKMNELKKGNDVSDTYSSAMALEDYQLSKDKDTKISPQDFFNYHNNIKQGTVNTGDPSLDRAVTITKKINKFKNEKIDVMNNQIINFDINSAKKIYNDFEIFSDALKSFVADVNLNNKEVVDNNHVKEEVVKYYGDKIDFIDDTTKFLKDMKNQLNSNLSEQYKLEQSDKVDLINENTMLLREDILSTPIDEVIESRFNTLNNSLKEFKTNAVNDQSFTFLKTADPSYHKQVNDLNTNLTKLEKQMKIKKDEQAKARLEKGIEAEPPLLDTNDSENAVIAEIQNSHTTIDIDNVAQEQITKITSAIDESIESISKEHPEYTQKELNIIKELLMDEFISTGTTIIPQPIEETIYEKTKVPKEEFEEIVRAYSTIQYRVINSLLRGQTEEQLIAIDRMYAVPTVKAELNENIDKLKKVLSEESFPEDTKVYRGTNLKNILPDAEKFAFDENIQKLQKMIKNKTIVQEKGFMSTSKNENQALEFMNQFKNDSDAYVVTEGLKTFIEFTNTLGAEAVDISQINNDPNQKEVLFNAGTSFVIENVIFYDALENELANMTEEQIEEFYENNDADDIAEAKNNNYIIIQAKLINKKQPLQTQLQSNKNINNLMKNNLEKQSTTADNIMSNQTINSDIVDATTKESMPLTLMPQDLEFEDLINESIDTVNDEFLENVVDQDINIDFTKQELNELDQKNNDLIQETIANISKNDDAYIDIQVEKTTKKLSTKKQRIENIETIKEVTTSKRSKKVKEDIEKDKLLKRYNKELEKINNKAVKEGSIFNSPSIKSDGSNLDQATPQHISKLVDDSTFQVVAQKMIKTKVYKTSNEQLFFQDYIWNRGLEFIVEKYGLQTEGTRGYLNQIEKNPQALTELQALNDLFSYYTDFENENRITYPADAFFINTFEKENSIKLSIENLKRMMGEQKKVEDSFLKRQTLTEKINKKYKPKQAQEIQTLYTNYKNNVAELRQEYENKPRIIENKEYALDKLRTLDYTEAIQDSKVATYVEETKNLNQKLEQELNDKIESLADELTKQETKINKEYGKLINDEIANIKIPDYNVDNLIKDFASRINFFSDINIEEGQNVIDYVEKLNDDLQEDIIKNPEKYC